MSNYLYPAYGIAAFSPWFPGLRHLKLKTLTIDHASFQKEHGLLCGIYFLCSNQGVSYIGQSKNIWRRLDEHTNPPIDFAYVFELPEKDLLKWEKAAIRFINPEFNDTHRNIKKNEGDHIGQMQWFIYEKKLPLNYPTRRVFRIDYQDYKEDTYLAVYGDS